jgi:hypothetical protein
MAGANWTARLGSVLVALQTLPCLQCSSFGQCRIESILNAPPYTRVHLYCARALCQHPAIYFEHFLA